MIDFLLEALLTPGAAWVGLVLGLLAAYGAWVLLPESVDRASLGAWLVAGGFAAGLLYAAATRKKQ